MPSVTPTKPASAPTTTTGAGADSMARMRRASAGVVVAVALGALFVAVAGARPGPAAPRADRALRRALSGLVHAKGGPVGAIAVVQRGSKTQTYSSGSSRVGGRRPIPRDAMRLASTSKAFNGAVALALVSRRVLSLNDTIGKLLPKLPRAWGRVTLREALQHTSGLPNFTESPSYLKALEKSPAHGPKPRQLLRYVEKQPLHFKPGSRYRYSNTDNVIAGLMVEHVTGHSYEHELRTLVLRPVGLRHTALPSSVAMPRPLFHGYQLAAGKWQDLSTVISPAWTWAAGGMISTPADLNRFARAYIGGRLFSGRVRKAQLRTVAGASEPPGPGTNSAGLAVFRYRTRCGTVYGHTGNFPGYTQFFAATLNGQRSVTVSINEQLSPIRHARVFKILRRVDAIAVCAALAH